jgi:hypothetical protein
MKCINCEETCIHRYNNYNYFDICSAILEDIKALNQMLRDLEYEYIRRQNKDYMEQ